METNSNHSTNEVTKTIEKTLTSSTKEIMDFYTKQLNVATVFYKNLFDPFANANKTWDNNSHLHKGFFGNDITKLFSMPLSGFNGNFSNPLMPMYDQMMKQMLDYNASMFANLPTGLKVTMNMTELSKKYQEGMNAGIESYRGVLKTVTESFNKQLDVSIEANKKVTEEMNHQLQIMVKQNQQFWFDVTIASQTKANSVQKNVKDSITPEIKKRTAIPTNELSDHKV